jgi:hypothetical protein
MLPPQNLHGHEVRSAVVSGETTMVQGFPDPFDWERMAPDDQARLLRDHAVALLAHATTPQRRTSFVRNYLLRIVAPTTDLPEQATAVLEHASDLELLILATIAGTSPDAACLKVLLEGGQVEITGNAVFHQWEKAAGGRAKRRGWVTVKDKPSTGLGAIAAVTLPGIGGVIAAVDAFVDPGIPSSHRGDKGTHQYEVPGTCNILFWQQGGNTRVQLEGHGTSVTEIKGHGGDYQSYQADPEHRSVGPAGRDEHNDQKPYRLTLPG